MISKTIKYIGSLDGAASAGARLTKELTPKGSYNCIMVRCKIDGALMTDAQMATCLGNVEVLVSGQQKINIDSTAMNKIASRMIRNFPTNGGILTIPLFIPYYDIFGERYNLTYAMGDQSSLTLALNIKATSGTVMTFEVFADWDIDDISVLGPHVCYQTQNFVTGGGAQFDNSTVNAFSDGSAIMAHYLELVGGTAPTIDKLIIDVNGKILVDNWSPDVNVILNGMSRRETGLGSFATEVLYDGSNKPTGAWFMRAGGKIRFRANLGGTAVATSVNVHTVYMQGVPTTATTASK